MQYPEILNNKIHEISRAELSVEKFFETLKSFRKLNIQKNIPGNCAKLIF